LVKIQISVSCHVKGMKNTKMLDVYLEQPIWGKRNCTTNRK